VFTLRSPAFAEGGAIPRKYTHDGENLSPPLVWSDPPRGTRSFALICEDTDAPIGAFRHWAICNIPADQRGLMEGTGNRPTEICEFAQNDFGRAAYDGPAPPRGHGVHHYHFKVAALDVDEVEVLPEQSAAELWALVAPHIIAEAETVGTYQR